MFSENQKISLRQLQVLLILNIFGTGIITLPRRTAEAAGTDAWIGVLIGSIVMAAYSFLLTALAERFGRENFVEILQRFLTKPLGIVAAVLFAAKILLTTGLQLRVFCEIIRQTMLFKTPVSVTAIVMILVGAYAAARGYECRARAAEIVIILVLLPLLFIYSTALFSTDFTNLLPVFHSGMPNILKGAVTTAFAFSGIEFLLLAYPFLNKKQNNRFEIGGAVFIIGILMTVTTILTIGKFGDITVKTKLFPVLQMMDTVDFPGAFIERQDVFIMWFFTASAFAGINAGIYFSGLLFTQLMEEDKKRKLFILIIVPVLFFTAMAPQDIANAYSLLSAITLYGGGFYLFVIPIVLFFISMAQKKEAEENEKDV